MTSPLHRLGPCLFLLLAAALLQACYAKEPAREAAPPAPPAPAPPAAAPEPSPAEAPADMEAEQAEPSRARGVGDAESKPAGPALPDRARPAPATSAPLREERRKSVSSERDDGAGATDEAAPKKGTVASAELLMQRLGTAVDLTTPDCPSARDRKRAICDLAAQICRLVDNDPNVASVVEYCDDARKRCSDAEQRIAQRCE